MARVDSETIVVGVDASECSGRALEWAIGEARRSGRWLLLVNVWHWSNGALGSPMSLLGHEDVYSASRHILEQGARQARHEGVRVSTRLVEGMPANALVDAAEGAAMLVVGRHGQGLVRRSLVGSVSKGCLQHSHVPVVVIPSQPVPDAAEASGARPATAGKAAGTRH